MKGTGPIFILAISLCTSASLRKGRREWKAAYRNARLNVTKRLIARSATFATSRFANFADRSRIAHLELCVPPGAKGSIITVLYIRTDYRGMFTISELPKAWSSEAGFMTVNRAETGFQRKK
jgi:hypothetical protein